MRTSVLIAGAGPAAVETALGLRELAADRVDVTLLAPDRELVYRPVSVVEPFAPGAVRRYSLDEIARDVAAERVGDSLASVDARVRAAMTDAGRALRYDHLVVATGAVAKPVFEHAVTFWSPADASATRALVENVARGYVRRLAFVVPAGPVWPLPLYELALQTAAAAHESLATTELHLVTPEDVPLAVFGPRASAAVADALAQAGVVAHVGSHAELGSNGVLTLWPSGDELAVDRAVAIPRLAGRAIPGLPADANGFLPVDRHGRVRGVDGVWAVGDATDFPIRQGGIATQQADAVAARIAAAAGAPVEPWSFQPVLRGMLVTDTGALWLQYEPAGGAGEGTVADSALWSPPTKIAGRWLGPYLDRLDGTAEPARPSLERTLDRRARGATR